MPIKIPNELPAYKTLTDENIFVMTETRALTQDIRPLQIAIVNLMPTKIDTETQLLRLLGNTSLQVETELIKMQSHVSKNTSAEHLTAFYKTFSEIRDRNFDGMIITGAPVEHLKFEEVEYWDELCEIMEWSKEHVHSTFHWKRNCSAFFPTMRSERTISSCAALTMCLWLLTAGIRLCEGKTWRRAES